MLCHLPQRKYIFVVTGGMGFIYLQIMVNWNQTSFNNRIFIRLRKDNNVLPGLGTMVYFIYNNGLNWNQTGFNNLSVSPSYKRI